MNDLDEVALRLLYQLNLLNTYRISEFLGTRTQKRYNEEADVFHMLEFSQEIGMGSTRALRWISGIFQAYGVTNRQSLQHLLTTKGYQ